MRNYKATRRLIISIQIASHTPEPFKDEISSDRIIALLGRAAHQSKVQLGECPSDEELLAFIYGKLTGKKRQAMVAHLNRCSTCYHDWIETALYLKSLEPTDKLVQKKWWQMGIEVFLLPKVWIPTAVTAILLITVWVPVWLQPSVTFHDNIAGFEVAVTLPNADTLQQAFVNLSEDTTTFGLNDPDMPPEIKAFSAGVEMQRAKLTQKEQTPEFVELAKWTTNSQWVDEYELGRWLVLLRTMVQTPEQTSKEFWVQQQTIGRTLQARFYKRSLIDDITQTILEVLAETLFLLSQLQNHSNNQDVISQLRNHLDFAIWGISSL